MYEELIRALHCCADDNIPCADCPRQAKCVEERNMNSLFPEAADAIEYMQKTILRLENELGIYDDLPMVYQSVVLSKMEKTTQWIPVTERLPKYGERVLVFGGVTIYVAYYDKNRYGGESWHKLNSKSHYCNPTHWMPLPEPPKEERE